MVSPLDVGITGVFISVAKERMICPFSNKICEECALYRGRHYYLCFYRKYRGYIGKTGKGTKEELLPNPAEGSKTEFEIPLLNVASALDPFDTDSEKHEQEED